MRSKCDPEVFNHGIGLGFFDMEKEEAEAYCIEQTQTTGRKHDWHYAAGRVHIKALPEEVIVSVPRNKLMQLLDMQEDGEYYARCELANEIEEMIKEN